MKGMMSEDENATMRKSFISDQGRRALWRHLQSLTTDFFEATQPIFLALSVRELFDVLSLTNKFLEIGFEFSSCDKISSKAAREKESPLLNQILSMCN